MPKKKKGKGNTAQVAAPIQVKRLPPKPCGTSLSIASLSHHSMAVTALQVSCKEGTVCGVRVVVYTDDSVIAMH